MYFDSPPSSKFWQALQTVLPPESLALEDRSSLEHTAPESLADWLVIADDHPELLSQLLPVFAQERWALVPVQQVEWKFRSELHQRILSWVLTRYRWAGIVLVGSSLSSRDSLSRGALLQPAFLPAAESPQPRTARRAEELAQGAIRRQTSVELSRRTLMEQVCQVQKLPVVTTQQRHRGLQVHGFWYHADSGQMLAYHSTRNVFEPLNSGLI